MKNYLKIVALLLVCSNIGFAQVDKPQTPKAPFSYSVEEVTYINKDADSITLAGTLTLPKDVKNPAVAILINGSGAHDRDCSILGHKPFNVIADYLTLNGIAVLRSDERGTAQSEGDISTATTFDLASDVKAAMRYLKARSDIDSSKIGLIGHSEGGLIAPIIASSDKDVAFIVMLAGPGIDGGKTIQNQANKMLISMNLDSNYIELQNKIYTGVFDIIRNSKDESNDVLKSKIKTCLTDLKSKNQDNLYLNTLINESSIEQYYAFTSPWLKTFVKTSPKPYLEATTCPILVLNGSKDTQVIAETNLPEIEKHLKTSGNNDVTIQELESLNHLFQTAETGSTNEYGTIEETFSPTALKLISDWINKRF